MVHIFTQNGFRICLDVNSGAIHVLDEEAYSILSRCSSRSTYEAYRNEAYCDSPPELRSAFDDIDELIDEGNLFSEMNIPEKEEVKPDVELKALCLHMAHACNLRCSYCFAGDGEYSGGTRLMPFETAKRAVDLLLSKSGKKRNVEIDFFGGEPMLDFEVVRKTVEYASAEQGKYGKEIHFTITTNGTILDDESLMFINEHMDNVVLSIDGRKEVHDRFRKFPDGSGSYDEVLPNIRKIVDGRKGKSYFVRGTYTAHNLDFHRDVEHLASLGFTDISIEPVTGGEFELTDAEVDKAADEYEILAERYAPRRDYTFYHFNIDLYNSPCIYKRINACGAGFEYGAVTPDGDIFACHRLVGIPEFRMGSVYEEGLDPVLARKMRGNNVMTVEECRNCWARFFCSGGCPATAYLGNGSISKPDKNACRLQRKRIECAMAVEVQRAAEEK